VTITLIRIGIVVMCIVIATTAIAVKWPAMNLVYAVTLGTALGLLVLGRWLYRSGDCS